MKKLWKRLKSKCGETLIETLAAIVVFTLASVILLTMTTSAADLAQTNKDVAERIHAEMVYAEKGSDSGGAASGGSSFLDDTGASVDTGFVFNCNAYSVNGAYFTVPADGPKKGKVMLKSTRNSELMMDIVNEGAYPGGLEIADFTSTYVPVGADGKAGGYATISYKIVSPDTDRESDPIELCIRFANVK